MCSGKRRYNIRLWKTFTDCFNCLPVAAILDEKIFCCHGGKASVPLLSDRRVMWLCFVVCRPLSRHAVNGADQENHAANRCSRPRLVCTTPMCTEQLHLLQVMLQDCSVTCCGQILTKRRMAGGRMTGACLSPLIQRLSPSF